MILSRNWNLKIPWKFHHCSSDEAKQLCNVIRVHFQEALAACQELGMQYVCNIYIIYIHIHTLLYIHMLQLYKYCHHMSSYRQYYSQIDIDSWTDIHQIDGQMDRWIDGWVMMGGQMDRWIDGSMDRWIDGQMDRWIDGQMDRWLDGQIRIQEDRNIGRQIDRLDQIRLDRLDR